MAERHTLEAALYTDIPCVECGAATYEPCVNKKGHAVDVHQTRRFDYVFKSPYRSKSARAILRKAGA